MDMHPLENIYMYIYIDKLPDLRDMTYLLYITHCLGCCILEPRAKHPKEFDFEGLLL